MNKCTKVISFGIGYSRSVGGGFYHSFKRDVPTSDTKEICNDCLRIFDKYYEDLPIRKVSIALGGLSDDTGMQLNLFESIEEKVHNKSKDKVVDSIKDKLDTYTYTFEKKDGHFVITDFSVEHSK